MLVITRKLGESFDVYADGQRCRIKLEKHSSGVKVAIDAPAFFKILRSEVPLRIEPPATIPTVEPAPIVA